MTSNPLDNPIWVALQTGHAHLARGDAQVKAYAPDVGPFAAVAAAGATPADASVEAALPPDTHVYFIGRLPVLSPRWLAVPLGTIVQMVWSPPRLPATPPAIALRELGEADVPQMLALTALVFPGYFRARTMTMGRYVGLFDGGTLVAMGGERFLVDRYCELSAICTHPAFAGRGHARAIIQHLVTAIVGRGQTPFLHVSPENVRARALYESLGFATRADVDLLRVMQTPSTAARV